ncbi:MAG: regulatory protein RecX [Firmicutes bacterium]|nr:regulatory protein RecX [Bacillota bacterium]
MSHLDIRDVAARYLAYRSHTCREMQKHLLQKGFSEEDTAAVIAEFIEFGYLDDSRYCMQYFDYAFGKGKGKRLVFAELKEKGVSSDTIQFAFEDWEAEHAGEYDEKTRAREEAEKVLRMAGKEEIDEKLLAKIGRRLQSKGYSSDVIYSVIGALRR